jgi:hypothetical protein
MSGDEEEKRGEKIESRHLSNYECANENERVKYEAIIMYINRPSEQIRENECAWS